MTTLNIVGRSGLVFLDGSNAICPANSECNLDFSKGDARGVSKLNVYCFSGSKLNYMCGDNVNDDSLCPIETIYAAMDSEIKDKSLIFSDITVIDGLSDNQVREHFANEFGSKQDINFNFNSNSNNISGSSSNGFAIDTMTVIIVCFALLFGILIGVIGEKYKSRFGKWVDGIRMVCKLDARQGIKKLFSKNNDFESLDSPVSAIESEKEKRRSEYGVSGVDCGNVSTDDNDEYEPLYDSIDHDDANTGAVCV